MIRLSNTRLIIVDRYISVSMIIYLASLFLITPAECAVSVANNNIGKLDLEIASSSKDQTLLRQMSGFTNKNTLILVNVEDVSRSKGSVIQQEFTTRKIISQLPLSSTVDPYKLSLSPNGNILITCENIADVSEKIREAHMIKVLDSTNLSILKTIDLGKGHHIVNISFLNGSSDRIIVQLIAAIPYKENIFTYGHDRFIVLNLKTGKAEKTISYSRARSVSVPLFSPDGKYLACLFYSDDDNDQLGILDVLDPKTGKILWHIEGSAKQPIGDPFFFISPTRFVSSSRIYDITTKKSSPLIPANDPRLYCLKNVPQKTDYAFFMTKNGLELWNIKTRKALRRWPTLKERGYIRMSPDLKVMSFQRDKNIEFWKFDPTWLK